MAAHTNPLSNTHSITDRYNAGPPSDGKARSTKKSRISGVAANALTSETSVAVACEAEDPIRLSRQCKWVIKLYKAGEKTLAQIYLHSLSNLPRRIIDGSILPHFTPQQNIELFEVFKDGSGIRLNQLFSGAAISDYTPESSEIARKDEFSRYIVFGYCDPTVLKVTLYYPRCCVPFTNAGSTWIRKLSGNTVFSNIMEYMGNIQAVAAVSREWRHIVHSLVAPYIPRIINHIDGIKSLFEERFDADANFLFDDLIMRTVRTLTENFIIRPTSILDELDKQICGMLSNKSLLEKITDQPHLVKRVIKENPKLLETAPAYIQGDVDFIKELVQIDGLCIKYAAPHLRAHPDIILLAIKQNPDAYKFIEGPEKENEVILELTFSKNGKLFCSAPEKVKENRKYLKRALQTDGGFAAVRSALLGEGIWYDREIVDLALMNNRQEEDPILLEPTLPGILKDERDFNLRLCIKNTREFPHTDERFRSDFNFCRLYFLEQPNNFVYLHYEGELLKLIPKPIAKKLWLDRDISLAIIGCNEFTDFNKPIITRWLKVWGKDREVMKAASLLTCEDDERPFGEALKYADEALFRDVSFIKEVVAEVGLALQWIPADILSTYDVEVFEIALKNNPDADSWVPQRMFDAHPHLYDLALKGNSETWLHVLPKSEEAYLANARVAIKRNYKVFRLFPPSFKARAEFVEAAVKGSADMICFATPDWREDDWKFRQVLYWNPATFNFALPQFRSYHYFKISVIGRHVINSASKGFRESFFMNLLSYLEELKKYRRSSKPGRDSFERERKI